MRNPDPSRASAGQPATAKAGSEAYNRIATAIKTLPLSDLKSIIMGHYAYEVDVQAGNEVVDQAFQEEVDLSVHRKKADTAIESLVLIAELGDREAVRHLAYLGCVIANVLANLLESSRNDMGRDAASSTLATPGAESGTWPYGPGDGMPDFHRDYSTLSNFPPDELEKILINLEEKHPGESALVYLDDLAKYPGRAPSDEPTPEKFALVERIVQKLVGIRINRHAGEVSRQCAEEAQFWPIIVQALADGRRDRTETYVKSLNLGVKTGLDNNQHAGSGESRKLKSGSRTGFAFDVFNALDRERTRMRDRYLFPIGDEGPVSKSEWISKAAKLTKLEMSPAVLESWHDAAMAYCNHLCSGEFASFEWPSSVDKRSRRRSYSPTEKVVRNAVSTSLRAGLTALATQTQAAGPAQHG
jgi:hypothetical protein